MFDIYTPCPDTLDHETCTSRVRDQAQAVLMIVHDLAENLDARLKAQQQALDKVVSQLHARIKRRLTTNQKQLTQVLQALLDRLTTRVSENAVAMNAVVAGLPASEQTQVAAGLVPMMVEPEPEKAPPVAPKTAPPSPPPPPPPPSSPAPGPAPSTQPAAAPQPAPGSGDSLDQLEQQINEIIQGNPDMSVLLAPLLPLVSAARHGCAAAGQQPGMAGALAGPAAAAAVAAPPVDLDQPLAFKFAPDDAPWKQQAELFYGDWLAAWDQAGSLQELVDARDQTLPQEADIFISEQWLSHLLPPS